MSVSMLLLRPVMLCCANAVRHALQLHQKLRPVIGLIGRICHFRQCPVPSTEHSLPWDLILRWNQHLISSRIAFFFIAPMYRAHLLFILSVQCCALFHLAIAKKLRHPSRRIARFFYVHQLIWDVFVPSPDRYAWTCDAKIWMCPFFPPNILLFRQRSTHIAVSLSFPGLCQHLPNSRLLHPRRLSGILPRGGRICGHLLLL